MTRIDKLRHSAAAALFERRDVYNRASVFLYIWTRESN